MNCNTAVYDQVHKIRSTNAMAPATAGLSATLVRARGQQAGRSRFVCRSNDGRGRAGEAEQHEMGVAAVLGGQLEADAFDGTDERRSIWYARCHLGHVETAAVGLDWPTMSLDARRTQHASGLFDHAEPVAAHERQAEDGRVCDGGFVAGQGDMSGALGSDDRGSARDEVEAQSAAGRMTDRQFASQTSVTAAEVDDNRVRGQRAKKRDDRIERLQRPCGRLLAKAGVVLKRSAHDAEQPYAPRRRLKDLQTSSRQLPGPCACTASIRPA